LAVDTTCLDYGLSCPSKLFCALQCKEMTGPDRGRMKADGSTRAAYLVECSSCFPARNKRCGSATVLRRQGDDNEFTQYGPHRMVDACAKTDPRFKRHLATADVGLIDFAKKGRQ